jgi:hypothetical protein
MWFAVAILGVIAIATGVTLLPGAQPKPAPVVATPAPPAAPAPSVLSPAQPMSEPPK